MGSPTVNTPSLPFCRSMEQLQCWVDGDPLEQLTTPLFLPSSTLLSMPTTIRHTPTARTREASFTQVRLFPDTEIGSLFKLLQIKKIFYLSRSLMILWKK